MSVAQITEADSNLRALEQDCSRLARDNEHLRQALAAETAARQALEDQVNGKH